jgi:hypothetical protein
MRKGVNRIAQVGVVLSALALAPGAALAAPAADRSYVCFVQLAAVDESAHTATLKAQIADHVGRYVKQFKSGDRLVLVWDMIRKTQADTALALWAVEDVKNSALRSGYILPIQFGSVDVEGKTVTFTARVPDKGLATMKSQRPGQWLKLTVPMEQPDDQATITAIEASEKPRPVETSQTSAAPTAPAKPENAAAPAAAPPR